MGIKPRGYWTKERCHEVALTCNSRAEFKKKYGSAHHSACKNGWIDQICSHMENKVDKKPRGYWTKEKCHKIALNYNSRYEFEQNDKSAYSASHKYGWLNEVCSHMIYKIKPPGYWTKEMCHELALKCKNRREFCLKYGSAYRAAHKNGWIDEITSHMKLLVRIPLSYWTKEICLERALKYSNRTEFLENDHSAYSASHKKGWIDEICSHMTRNKIKSIDRYVYVYEFDDNHVYVGLSRNTKHRNSQHLLGNKRTKSRVYQHYLICDKYNFFLVTDTPITEKEASELEKSVTMEYLNNGWVVLNNIPSLGTLGGPYLIWTKEKCHEVALKCKSRSEFSKKYGSAYYASRKNGWLDEVCSHMVQIIKPKNYWTKEKCHEAALKCESRSEFSEKYKGAHCSARKNGWLDEICSHMEK